MEDELRARYEALLLALDVAAVVDLSAGARRWIEEEVRAVCLGLLGWEETPR